MKRVKEALDFGATYEFQFLIGSVKSFANCQYQVLRYEFQFLIGSVKRISELQHLGGVVLFQFLIGSVKSRLNSASR